MTDVKLEAFRDGDGYLLVDTEEWLDARTDLDDELTDAFHTYAEAQGDSDLAGQTERLVIAWLRERYGPAAAEPQMDTYTVGTASWWTGNHENYFTRDWGATLVGLPWPDDESNGYSRGTADDYLLIITATVNGWVLPPSATEVGRITCDEPTDVYDWARAYGSCANEHHLDTDDAYTMASEGVWTSDTPKLSDYVRVPDDDRDAAYVACPTCGSPIVWMVWP